MKPARVARIRKTSVSRVNPRVGASISRDLREALGPGTQFVGVRGRTLEAITGHTICCL